MRSEPRDLELFNDCFGRNDARRATASLEWQYLRNPTGELFVDLAQPATEERIAAIYASLPVFLRVQGTPRLALQSLDTLTDADFRGRGLFVSLAKRVFERATQSGAALIYGFPNKNSAPGFFKKLGWKNLDPIPFLIRPLRARYVARRVRPSLGWVPNLPLVFPHTFVPSGLSVREVDGFDVRFDDLWTEFASKIPLGVERDARYLNWRLVDKPIPRYRRLAAFRGDRLVAFTAFYSVEKHGGRTGYLMELVHRRGEAGAAVALARLGVDEMANEGADFALAMCFEHSPNFSAYLRAGFFPFPERFRPVELHFGARAFDPALERIASDRRAWYLSYLDADTA